METPKKKIHQDKNRLNALDGKTWTRYSISIWDISKTSEESGLQHSALFPRKLVQRLLEIYTKPGDTILDPFMGAGSTLVAAQQLNRSSIGFEIVPQFIKTTQERLDNIPMKVGQLSKPTIYAEDARSLVQLVNPNSIDMVVTSPPYWDIHRQQRTADRKDSRPYSSSSQDIGNISSYSEFLKALGTVTKQLFTVTKPNRWCALIVMDIRKKKHFYPFHIDCVQIWKNNGFELEDIIIWDRRSDYHNLRPLGYPTVFRVNKVHEYILLFRKPS